METIKLYFTGAISKIAQFLYTVLPKSPFREYLRGYEDGGSGLLKAVNYFVPIPAFIVMTYAWVTAMFLYYLYHALVTHVWNGKDAGAWKNIKGWIKNVFSALKLIRR